ncbi:MAG: glycosyltransferase family 1 protein [Cellulomonadaceae bacterium]
MASVRPRLLILSFSPIASDARVLKQVRLFTPDYEVTTCGYGPAPDGVAAHLRIDDEAKAWRLHPRWLLLRQFRRVYDANAAVRAARALLAGREFDVVLADDADTVPLAMSIAPGDRVHVDLHEYAPRQKEELPRWRRFVAPYVRWEVRKARRAASVTTVGQGIADEYRRRFGIDAQVVTNAAPYAELAPTAVADDAPLRVVHSGVALRSRHLELVVEGARGTGITLDLLLVANDPAYLAELTQLAADIPEVRILPPVPYADLVTTLNAYDVGVHILPPVNFNNAWALPNKFFDYVQARLGVVVGPSPEMARLVRENGIGVVTEEFTAASVRAAFAALTPELVRGFKARSDEAAHDLSSEQQVLVWKAAVDAISGR